MENMKKRVLSLTLALVLALSLLPIGVLAADETYKIGQSYDFDTNVESKLPKVPGAHWVGPTAKQGDLICAEEHAHSADCVAEKNATKIDASEYNANNPEMFALDTYYALDCNETEDMSKHNESCYTGKQGDLTPFFEYSASGFIRKIGDATYLYQDNLGNPGWYLLTCAKGGVHIHSKIAGCTDAETPLPAPQPSEVRYIGRYNMGDSTVDTMYSDLLSAEPTPHMYKPYALSVTNYAWYALNCTNPTHVHQHTFPDCYAKTGTEKPTDTATDYKVTTYYQCTTPAHTHVDGCYKTQYAWVLTADTAVKTHTYQVQYLYMLKNAKTGVYEPNGQSAWTIAAAVATYPDSPAVWATANASKEYSGITYSKRSTYEKTDIACLEGGKFEEDTLQYTIKLYGEQQVATTGTLTIHKTIQNLTESEQSTLTNQLIFDLEGPYEGGIDSVPPFSYDAKGMTLSGLRPGTYSVLEKNQKMPGYDLKTTYSWNDADPETPGQQIAIEAGDNGAITITNTYSKPKNDTTLTIHKIVKGLDGDDAALEALKKSLTFDINGDITFDYSLPVSYDKFTDSSYTTQQLENAGTYTVTETGAEVPGYILTPTCDDLDGDPTNGYQVAVAKKQNAEITITNTYEKIPETVYSLIFDAGDNGVLQGGHATNGDPDNSDFHWTLDTTTNQYNWEKANTGMGTSLKRWTFHFTKANVTENIALRSGMAAKSPTPAITANDQNNPFQGFYLMKGDQMTDTAYSTNNALFTAYTAMQAAGTDTQTYRAKYSVTTPPVNPPVDPPVDPIPPVNPNPPVDPIPPVNPNPPIGGDDEYEPQNPATPPVTTLPNGEVPLAPLPGELVTDLPAEEIPLSNLPDEETPLADLPEEETPLADAPKTGDSFGIWAALLGISGVAIAGLTLGKRKKTEEN